MTVYGGLAFATQVLGLGLVFAGLYRRDPAAQRWWARLRGRVRRLFGRPPDQIVGIGAAVEEDMAGAAYGLVRPGARTPGADVPGRLGWLEQAADAAFSELDAERTYRTQDVRDLREQIGALRSDHNAAADELRRRLDEAGIPERLEWAGAGLVTAGLVFGVLDAITAG